MIAIHPNVFVRSSHIQKLQSVILVTDAAIVIVDPGFFPDEIMQIQNYASQFQTSSRAKYLLLTHSDFDHIAGAHAFPGYDVVAASTWDKSNEQNSIRKLEWTDTNNYVDRSWTETMPPITFDKLLDDAEQFSGFTFYHTKGHTADGLVLVHDRIAIVGDYLSALEFPFIFTSYVDYLFTLVKLRRVFTEHEVDLVVSQHGPAATTMEEIQHRIDLSEDYIRRLEYLIQKTIDAGLDSQAAVRRAQDFLYDNKPIPVGIQSLHDHNVEMVFKEMLAGHTEHN